MPIAKMMIDPIITKNFLRRFIMTTLNQNTDYRQRFFVTNSPVRGDVVQLNEVYQTVIQQKPYPKALQALLGELLVSASLLIGTLKIDGKLSIQLQSSDEMALLSFAMAECDSTGAMRAVAGFVAHGDWQHLSKSDEAFAQLGAGVLFISIHPESGNSYQGIVERVSDNLGECLAHYQKQSAQIPTIIKLATNADTAGGILVQLLPQSEQDKTDDPDLWERLTALTVTIKEDELTDLPANEILYRLYHEEHVTVPECMSLHFACTCSYDKSVGAIIQLGQVDALATVQEHGGRMVLDCGFCGKAYVFDERDVSELFA